MVPFDDVMIVMAGEFGRTPKVFTFDGAKSKLPGRDHWGMVQSVFFAGGGVKGGFSYGSTDEFGYEAVDGKMHIHDWHATILNLLGLDHEKLTYRYAGRDFRLTDVAGNVVTEIFA